MKPTDTDPVPADNVPKALANRQHQMFPQLTDAEIARISRFGTLRRYARGERLFAAGEPGAVSEPLNRTIEAPRVFFDIYQAPVIYSGLAPGVAGRYQVTVRVPAQLSPAANISVSVTIGGFASNRVTISVR